MALFDTTAFRVLEQGMSVLWQKQQIISQNIANADTPDYNCKYVEFSGVLREKLRANGSIKNELNLTYSVITDRATRDQADGNNVDNDTQMAELANAQIQYDALINSMNGNFTRMRSALVTK
ncbi:MAG: flagellar basal body rod protein FlgB [Oscillospiraceae bacterium]|nr:flagellar basal body rod protein FlgB [Oscillospiraceae bacterium]